MRDSQKLDPQSLKAFYYAADTLSFTQAAKQAALTQSGVSQHISRLEAELGTSLFVRAGRRVLLTDAGHKLRAFTEGYLDQVDTLLDYVREEGQSLKGRVRYAMPNSCLFTPHFPILLDERRKFPGIDLQVKICHSEEVIECLLRNEIDFGFVTRASAHADVVYEEFAREEYVLVGAKGRKYRVDRVSELKDLDFVAYPGVEVLLQQWQHSVFPKTKPLTVSDLRVRGEINNLAGAITMVSHAVGVSVFPRHCVDGELAAKTLESLSRTGEEQTPIYIVTLKGTRKTARVQKVLDAFWKMR